MRGILPTGDVSPVRLFGWLAVLTLLCNHPKAFRNKLLQDQKTSKPSQKQPIKSTEMPQPLEGDDRGSPNSADEEMPGDEDVYTLGFSEDMKTRMLATIPEEAPVELSYRMMLVRQIIELAEKAKDKTLIFSHSIATLNCMEELLDEMGFIWARIDGSKAMKARNKVLDDFKAGSIDVLLISTRAGGLGLNIQTANRVIILDYGFNPTWEEQAIGRAYRLGQVKPVFVYRFVAGGTFEKRLYEMGLFKTGLASRVVDKKNPTRHAARNPQQWIAAPTEVLQEDLDDVGGDKEVLDQILAKHHAGQDSFIRAIKTMETLQREADDEPLDEQEQREVAEEIEALLMRKGPSSTIPL